MLISAAGRDQDEASPLASRRLWSLWDIMTPFPLEEILGVTHVAGHFYPAFAGWGGLMPGRWKRTNIISQDDRAKFDDLYQDVQQMCERLELDASAATVKKMRQCLSNTKSTYGVFFGFGNELHERMRDQLQGKSVFILTMKEAGYFQHPRQGWEAIIDRFPDAVTDIEESRKCFALSRYPAAIFHSLQVVEFGLIELGVLVGATDPLSGWTATTNALKKIIDTKYHERTAFQKTHFAFFEQMHATVEGLKNAWRNKVSHAQGKLALLTSDFGPDVAEEILYATRAFMRRLATDAPASSQGRSS